jgi:AcrR family transcriptional regulator
MKTPVRKYSSPLRQSHTQDTRERILQATAELLETSPHGDISMDEVARAAGVERRTVFRHFSSKEALFDAFWDHINARMDVRFPESLDELLKAPKTTFAKFDAHEGVIRASLHTQTGQAMRLRSIPARQAAFHGFLGEALAGADPDTAAKAEAILHLLLTASSWETLRDYCGLDGRQAGEAVTWAMKAILAAARDTSDNSTKR